MRAVASSRSRKLRDGTAPGGRPQRGSVLRRFGYARGRVRRSSGAKASSPVARSMAEPGSGVTTTSVVIAAAAPVAKSTRASSVGLSALEAAIVDPTPEPALPGGPLPLGPFKETPLPGPLPLRTGTLLCCAAARRLRMSFSRSSSSPLRTRRIPGGTTNGGVLTAHERQSSVGESCLANDTNHRSLGIEPVRLPVGARLEEPTPKPVSDAKHIQLHVMPTSVVESLSLSNHCASTRPGARTTASATTADVISEGNRQRMGRVR